MHNHTKYDILVMKILFTGVAQAGLGVEGHYSWFSVDLQGFALLAVQQLQQWLPRREEGKLYSTRSSASHEDSSEVDSLQS